MCYEIMIQQMTSEVHQMKVGRCVLWWSKYITLHRQLERCHVKNINSHRAWSCGAIGQKLNYYLSSAFESLHHTDVIASHLLFSPLTLTKYQK
jgi:hypothetical protein